MQRAAASHGTCRCIGRQWSIAPGADELSADIGVDGTLTVIPNGARYRNLGRRSQRSIFRQSSSSLISPNPGLGTMLLLPDGSS